MGTLADLEARVAALEASQADYRAVLAAVNALGANQRDHAMAISGLRADVTQLQTELAEFREETRAVARSTDEHFAELRDLIIGLRGNGDA